MKSKLKIAKGFIGYSTITKAPSKEGGGTRIIDVSIHNKHYKYIDIDPLIEDFLIHQLNSVVTIYVYENQMSSADVVGIIGEDGRLYYIDSSSGDMAAAVILGTMAFGLTIAAVLNSIAWILLAGLFWVIVFSVIKSSKEKTNDIAFFVKNNGINVVSLLS